MSSTAEDRELRHILGTALKKVLENLEEHEEKIKHEFCKNILRRLRLATPLFGGCLKEIFLAFRGLNLPHDTTKDIILEYCELIKEKSEAISLDADGQDNFRLAFWKCKSWAPEVRRSPATPTARPLVPTPRSMPSIRSTNSSPYTPGTGDLAMQNTPATPTPTMLEPATLGAPNNQLSAPLEAGRVNSSPFILATPISQSVAPRVTTTAESSTSTSGLSGEHTSKDVLFAPVVSDLCNEYTLAQTFKDACKLIMNDEWLAWFEVEDGDMELLAQQRWKAVIGRQGYLVGVDFVRQDVKEFKKWNEDMENFKTNSTSAEICESALRVLGWWYNAFKNGPDPAISKIIKSPHDIYDAVEELMRPKIEDNDNFKLYVVANTSRWVFSAPIEDVDEKRMRDKIEALLKEVDREFTPGRYSRYRINPTNLLDTSTRLKNFCFNFEDTRDKGVHEFERVVEDQVLTLIKSLRQGNMKNWHAFKLKHVKIQTIPELPEHEEIYRNRDEAPSSASQPASLAVASTSTPPEASTSAQATTSLSSTMISMPNSTGSHNPSIGRIPGLNLGAHASSTQPSSVSAAINAAQTPAAPAPVAQSSSVPTVINMAQQTAARVPHTNTSATWDGSSTRSENPALVTSTTGQPLTGNRSSTRLTTPTAPFAAPSAQPTTYPLTRGPSTLGTSITTPVQNTPVAPLQPAHNATRGTAAVFRGSVRPFQVVRNQTFTTPSNGGIDVKDTDMKDIEVPANDPKAESDEMDGVDAPALIIATPLPQLQGTLANVSAPLPQSEVKDVQMGEGAAPPMGQTASNEVQMGEAPAPSTEDHTGELGEAPDCQNTSTPLTQPQTSSGSTGTAEPDAVNTTRESKVGVMQDADASVPTIGPESKASLPPVSSLASSPAGILKRPSSQRKLQRWDTVRSQSKPRRSILLGSSAVGGGTRFNKHPRRPRNRRWVTDGEDLLNVAGQVSNCSRRFLGTPPSNIQGHIGSGQRQSVAIKQQTPSSIDVPVQAVVPSDNNESAPTTNDNLKDISNVDDRNTEEYSADQKLSTSPEAAAKLEISSSQDLSLNDGNGSQSEGPSSSLASDEPGATLVSCHPDTYHRPNPSGEHTSIAQQGSLSATAGPSDNSSTDNTVPPIKDTDCVQHQEEAEPIVEDVRVSDTHNEGPVKQEEQAQTVEDTDATVGIQYTNSGALNGKSGKVTTPTNRAPPLLTIVGATTEGVELANQFRRDVPWQEWLPDLLMTFLLAIVLLLEVFLKFGLRGSNLCWEWVLTPCGTVLWDLGVVPTCKAVQEYAPTVGGYIKGAVSGHVGTLCKMVATGWSSFCSAQASDPTTPQTQSPTTWNATPRSTAPTQLHNRLAVRHHPFDSRKFAATRQPDTAARPQSRPLLSSLRITPARKEQYTCLMKDASSTLQSRTFHNEDARQARALFEWVPLRNDKLWNGDPTPNFC